MPVTIVSTLLHLNGEELDGAYYYVSEKSIATVAGWTPWLGAGVMRIPRRLMKVARLFTLYCSKCQIKRDRLKVKMP